jgi:hypothetical protein
LEPPANWGRFNTPIKDRAAAKLPRWADAFPYVNGGLFSGRTDVPKFSRIAQRYLTHIGNLNWTKINPDIFGSMIQAVADENERSALGMHYTSVPNILKVLNPLFLDDLRDHLDRAGDNKQKLLNLRKRMSNIRVFDPACGSGNFLVIAYKQMREIEFTINKRRGEEFTRSDIRIQNFRGIELRDFSAEIARLALIIAEYQCDLTYRGQKDALAEFLPLDRENWITCGNALRLDWLSVCPPTGTGVKIKSDDLFDTPLDQAEIDFENEGGETYICGNPPYLGSTKQSPQQKEDLGRVFDGRVRGWKSLDYVASWFMKAADYGLHTPTVTTFVTTNSICQGQQVPIIWPAVFRSGHEITFAHTSFKWANLASHNAGVTVAIVAITNMKGRVRRLFSIDENGHTLQRDVDNINAYLTNGKNTVVEKSSRRTDSVPLMTFGNKPVDGGYLRLSAAEKDNILLKYPFALDLFRRIVGTSDFLDGTTVYCLWIEDDQLQLASKVPEITRRIDAVRDLRLRSRDIGAQKMSEVPHQFRELREAKSHTIIVPRITSEKREFLPVGIQDMTGVISSQCFGMYDAPIYAASIVMSKTHLAWVHALCGRLELRLMYSNTICWNTFPVPKLTEKNKADLTSCAEDILLAREAHFPATIADLYKPDAMPDDLRAAHDRNDETLERIYIGRRFKNDTERLEKLFEMYTKMTTQVPEQ